MKKFISRLPLLKWLFEKKEEEPLSFLSLDEQKSFIERRKALKPGEIMKVSPSEMAFSKRFTEVDKHGMLAGFNPTADYKNCVGYGYNAIVVSNPLDQQKFIVGEQCLAITGISDNERQRLENARRFPSRIYIPNGG